MKYPHYRVLILLGIAAVFTVAYASAPELRTRLVSLQITPALLALGWGFLFITIVIVITALRGRVYCSFFCPAGIVQEVAFRVGRFLRLSKLSYVRSANTVLLLLMVAVLLAIGFTSLANAVAPVGWFGRLILPPLDLIKDAVYGSDYAKAYVGLAGIGFIFAFVLLVAVPLFRGRWFCDRLCPIGAALGTIGTLALNKLHIDAEKCTSCRSCEKSCPMRCIDGTTKTLDASRCIRCSSCVHSCPVGAVSSEPTFSPARRHVLASGMAWVGTVAFLTIRGMGRGFAAVGRKVGAILPPGATDADSYFQKCIGCQSCAAACPVGIIKPVFPGMQPELRYDLGYCQYECTACSAACPTGALEPLPVEQKVLTRLATTDFSLDKCVIIAQQTACGACAEICPVHALVMVEQGNGLPTIPEFYPELCISCGACLHVCPASPPAFAITGLSKHETAQPPRRPEPESDPADGEGEALDFPF